MSGNRNRHNKETKRALLFPQDRWNRAGLKKYDIQAIERYINWRNTHVGFEGAVVKSRLEDNTVSFFSNDLEILKTAFDIDTSIPENTVLHEVDDSNLSTGTLYFKEKPEYNYRIFFKTFKVDDTLRKDFIEMIDRYSKNGEVRPSKGLQDWLNMPAHLSPTHPSISIYSYQRNRYKYSRIWAYYFLDYKTESTLTMLSLILDTNKFSRLYKLEKRPEKSTT